MGFAGSLQVSPAVPPAPPPPLAPKLSGRLRDSIQDRVQNHCCSGWAPISVQPRQHISGNIEIVCLKHRFPPIDDEARIRQAFRRDVIVMIVRCCVGCCHY
ncbi:hypothetical protein O3P69_007146 [Scylla paramamosain]|uniref:Uncharacterized protein n=1 Tax=Scylla paramamosain TaxID=85552 RepID=A0AAW0V1V9_SCYPA